MRKAHPVSGVEMGGHRVGVGTEGLGGRENYCRVFGIVVVVISGGALQLGTGHQCFVQHQAWQQWDSV